MTEPRTDIQDLQVDYVAVFTSEAGMRVLDDLKLFCRWGQSPYSPTSFRDTDRNIALHEVVQHVIDMMGESYENLQTEVQSNG
jgi:diadenosine tetraphosphatase ApaH/serine/threonine PP2A family protein phosphatase